MALGAVGGNRKRATRSGYPDNRRASAPGPSQRARPDELVVLLVDASLAGDVRARKERAPRRGKVGRLGERCKVDCDRGGRGDERYAVDGRVVGQERGGDVRLDTPPHSGHEAPGVGHRPDRGGVELPMRADLHERRDPRWFDHREHPLLALAHKDLARAHPLLP